MVNIFRPPAGSRGCAVVLAALLVGACHQPLAERHEYFATAHKPGDLVAAETERVLRHHQRLQLTRRACAVAGPAADNVSPGALVCAPPGRMRSAYGSRANAYRRWVEDGVRPLPSPNETASSIGGS